VNPKLEGVNTAIDLGESGGVGWVADSTSEARARCTGGGFGGLKRSQLRGDAFSSHSVSTLYVSSGLRFKLRFKPELLALLAQSYVLLVLLTVDFSYHRPMWVSRGPVNPRDCAVTCRHVMSRDTYCLVSNACPGSRSNEGILV